MTDIRRADRIRCLLRAQIIFNNRMSTVDCTIKNISETGAKLVLANTLSVPNEFELHIPQKGRSYRARMIWRDTESLGVEFVEAHTNDLSYTSPERRLEELEKQNAELKARVKALSKRLQDLGQDPDLAA